MSFSATLLAIICSVFTAAVTVTAVANDLFKLFVQQSTETVTFFAYVCASKVQFTAFSLQAVLSWVIFSWITTSSDFATKLCAACALLIGIKTLLCDVIPRRSEQKLVTHTRTRIRFAHNRRRLRAMQRQDDWTLRILRNADHSFFLRNGIKRSRLLSLRQRPRCSINNSQPQPQADIPSCMSLVALYAVTRVVCCICSVATWLLPLDQLHATALTVLAPLLLLVFLRGFFTIAAIAAAEHKGFLSKPRAHYPDCRFVLSDQFLCDLIVAARFSAALVINRGRAQWEAVAAFNRLVGDGRTHPHPGPSDVVVVTRKPQSTQQNPNREKASENNITREHRAAHERVTIDLIAIFDRHAKGKVNDLTLTLHVIDNTDPSDPVERLFTVKTSKSMMRDSMFFLRPSSGGKTMACHEFDCNFMDNQSGQSVARVSLPQQPRKPSDFSHQIYTFLALNDSKFGKDSGAVRWQEVKGDPAEPKFDGDDNVPTERMLHKALDKQRWARFALSIISGYTQSDAEKRTKLAHSLLSLPKLHLRTLRGKASSTLRNTFRNKQLQAPDSECYLEQLSARVQDKAVSEDGAVIERTADEIDEATIRRARQLVVDGFIGKAAATLSQGPQPERQSIDKVITELEKLHPKGDLPPDPTPKLVESWKSIAPVTQSELRLACNDGMQQSSPGPDGWTEELLSYVLESDDPRSIDDLCAFLTDICRAQVHESVAARLRAAILVGIPKTNGATRPIACGGMFIKLASRIALKRDEQSLRGRFGDLQRGVSTPNGAGIIIHRTRAFARKIAGTNRSILALDFSNAFNCPTRDQMAIHCSLHRHLAPLFNVEYRQHGRFFIRGSPGVASFGSERGARQGTTTGPAFFSLTIHRMLEELAQIPGVRCEGAYLDDIAICCDTPTAASKAYDHIEKRAGEMKLKLNETKCELMTGNETAYSSFRSTIPRVKCLKLLGAAVGLTPEEETVVLRKMYTDKFLPLFRRLQKMPNVQGLMALTMSGIPKLSHVIRCHEPAVCIDITREFDVSTLSTWQRWALCEADDLSRAFAALPVKRGGLGLTPQLEIMQGAYLASRDSALGSADGVAISQKTRTVQVMDRIEEFVDGQGPHIKRHRQHNMARHSAAAFRSPGLAANPAHWSAALRWRLFAPITGLPSTPSCPAGDACTKPAFSNGRDWMRHAAVCTHVSGHGVCARHAAVKVAFKQFLHRNLIPFDHAEPRDVRYVTCHCKKEIVEADLVEHVRSCTDYQQRGLATAPLRGSGPDIRVYFSPAEGVDSICVDVTVTSAEADSNCNTELNKLYDATAKLKHAKYDEMMKRRNEQLIVIALSESGVPSQETSNLVRKICAQSGANEHEELKRFCSEVAVAHGGALHNAERRAGIYVDHEKWHPAKATVSLIALSAEALAVALPLQNPARPGAERPTGAILAPMTHRTSQPSARLGLRRPREPSPARRPGEVGSSLFGLYAATNDGAAEQDANSSPDNSAAAAKSGDAAPTSTTPSAANNSSTVDSSSAVTTINNNTTIVINNNNNTSAPNSTPHSFLDTPLTQSDFIAMMSPGRSRFKTNIKGATGSSLNRLAMPCMERGMPLTPRSIIDAMLGTSEGGIALVRGAISVLLSQHQTKNMFFDGETMVPFAQQTIGRCGEANIPCYFAPHEAPSAAQFCLGILLQARVLNPQGAMLMDRLVELHNTINNNTPASALKNQFSQLDNVYVSNNKGRITVLDDDAKLTDEQWALLNPLPKKQKQQQPAGQQAGDRSSMVMLTNGKHISTDGAATERHDGAAPQ